MDGENNGSKPYEQIDDLGGFPPIFGLTPVCESQELVLVRLEKIRSVRPSSMDGSLVDSQPRTYGQCGFV